MMRLIILLFVTILLISCKESRQDRIEHLVNEWSGKTIRFPNIMCFTSYSNDTVLVQYARERRPYTILNYVDTIGCISCKLQLPRWKEMIREIDSMYPQRVNCLMVFNPQEKKRFVQYLKNNQFDSFVYIDEKDSLNFLNNFLQNEHFHTFLLDKDDKIIAIGNPILKPRVRELYFDIISGKTVVPSVGKGALTVASLSKDKVDLGGFSWNKERETEFVISNVGKLPLVINDVITSCGCIKVDYIKKPILPGENIILKIKYKAEQPEHFNKTIIVYCNAESAPFKLNISGNAK